jgi:CubicO group peptidase (beta-lactamase class C family)
MEDRTSASLAPEKVERRRVSVRATAARPGPLVTIVLILLASLPVAARSQAALDLPATLDSLARAHASQKMIPGVSVAVVHRGETLLEAGYGFVDLEWDVPTPADGSASYEIGSITKQFTAAAVMLLVEDGRLDLDADLTEYVDFDTRGRPVPLRRLLDHTSGIKGYTEMPVFGELMTLDLPRDSLVRLVEAEPFEFAPGTALIYNNSAYFLLGLVIEAVSEGSYEDFVAERLFAPAGMTRSYYCSETEMRDGRAHGYDAAGPDRLIRARYLDHTWPYAAGSLCSTVGDLARWNRALHGGSLLSASSYQAMTTPAPLEDGTAVRYAMGLLVDAPGGRRTIAHGGGINGFLSDGRFYPDDDLIVVVLQNSTGPVGPGALGSALAEAVLGPVPDSAEPAFAGDLGELTGTYSGAARGGPMTLTVLVEDGGLAMRVGDGATTAPAYRGDLRWDRGGVRVTFIRGAGGAVEEVRYDTGGGHYVLRRTGG